ncbi:hypothetical protein LY78DRAFT_748840 [Colletotrichum sublineola]|nr:hypothetical protein LY78DRAFT_748840 [Colletotrichum sublineola]
MLIWPTPLREDMGLSPESIDEQVDTTRTSLSDTFYESRANLILGVTLSLFVVSAIFVGLRVYVRAFVLRKWGIDDTMLVSSFIIVLFHDFVMCLATKFGIGRHFWTIPFRTLLQGQKLCMFIIVLYNVAFTAIKITFLFQYRRIFPLPKVELLCNIGIAFLSLFGISLVISTAVTYTLLFTNAYFDSSINILTWWIVNASIHLITDIFIFLLPMPLLGQLRLHKVQKLALFASFSLGFFTCAISIIRIISLPESLLSTDPTFDSAPTIVWSVAELSSAVICCCVPTLRPLVQRSRYLAGRGAHSGSVFNSTPLSRCNSQHHTGRMSSLISWASDTAVRKPKPSFSWNRSRQRSEQLTITEVDDIEPAPATPMMPVAPRLSAFRTTPVEPAMPRLEVNGVRRESGASIHNEGNWMKRNSTRGSICSEGSITNTENGVRRDLSVRRHMSIALTERDSDDDVYYFGVREEDVNCPTPLSPPPKYSK